jgi:hypothetical protein
MSNLKKKNPSSVVILNLGHEPGHLGERKIKMAEKGTYVCSVRQNTSQKL